MSVELGQITDVFKQFVERRLCFFPDYENTKKREYLIFMYVRAILKTDFLFMKIHSNDKAFRIGEWTKEARLSVAGLKHNGRI